MARIVDRGAITAAFVGVGMAVTLAIGFLLIIPIGPVYSLLAVGGGLIIGYYANARSARSRGEWVRIVPNALLAGLVTAVTVALLLLGTRALFFFADNGYPDFNRVENGVSVGPTCETGADCVYRRYLAAQPGDLADAGITDAASFEAVFWREQLGSALYLVVSTTAAALIGGALFGLAGPRRAAPGQRRASAPA